MENTSDARVNLTQKGLIEAKFHGKNNAIMNISRKGTIQLTFDYISWGREPAKTKRFFKRIQEFLVAVPNKELRISTIRIQKYRSEHIVSGSKPDFSISKLDITPELDQEL